MKHSNFSIKWKTLTFQFHEQPKFEGAKLWLHRECIKSENFTLLTICTICWLQWCKKKKKNTFSFQTLFCRVLIRFHNALLNCHPVWQKFHENDSEIKALYVTQALALLLLNAITQWIGTLSTWFIYYQVHVQTGFCLHYYWHYLKDLT